jgi:hypothetical protein
VAWGQFSQTSTLVAVTFDGPPSSGVAPAVVVEVGLTFPCEELMREASVRWLDDGGNNGERWLSLG